MSSIINFNMMHSVALGNSNLIVDEEDFVMIDSDHLADDDNWDYCDDVFSTTSSSPCFSVCSDLPAKIFDEVDDLYDDIVVSMLISDESEKADEITAENTQPSMSVEISTVKDVNSLETDDEPVCAEMSPLHDNHTDNASTDDSIQSRTVVSEDDDAKNDTSCTTRLCNKKRRKMMKLKKKAVAPVVAPATDLMRGNCSASKAPPRQARITSKSGKKFATVAASCAYESLASYREEMQLTRKCK